MRKLTFLTLLIITSFVNADILDVWKSDSGTILSSFEVTEVDGLIGHVIASTGTGDRPLIAYTNKDNTALIVGAIYVKTNSDDPFNLLNNQHKPHLDAAIDARDKSDALASKGDIIKNGAQILGKDTILDLKTALKQVHFIPEGNPESPVIWIAYDSTCPYCESLKAKTDDFTSVLRINWVPISLKESVITASITAYDIDANTLLFVDGSDRKQFLTAPTQESIATVLNNTKILKDHIELKTPTAIIVANNKTKIVPGINIEIIENLLKEINNG